MLKTFNSNISCFGGLFLIHKQLKSSNAISFIDTELGSRVSTIGYNYSDIILSRIYTSFCGGSSTEDVNYIRKCTLNKLDQLKIPSADTILRVDKELSTPCTYIETDSGKENKININPKLNRFLIRSAIYFNQLNPHDDNLIYDFDHQFIPAEKYDASYSYKNKKGYFPGVATISNTPVYIEGRNGNCNVKTAQLSTHIRAMNSLSSEGITPKYARMDSGSYIKEVTDYFHDQDVIFSIRANSSETLLCLSSKVNDWQAVTINFQDMEIASFPYEFGNHKHRIIAYRIKNKTGQISALTGDAKKYMFIITNDNDISEKQAIEFYNKRGDSERVFDIQNNDFNWNSMPHSFLDENTVYLIIMAVAHIMYKWILSIFCNHVDGINQTSRLKRFIFRFVITAAKFTKSGRRNFIHLNSQNKTLINMLNSS